MTSARSILHPSISAQAPWADGSLFADARHCLDLTEPFDPEATAQGQLPRIGPRPGVKARARAFQLFLTLAHHGLTIPMAFPMMVLRLALGLDATISHFGRVAQVLHADHVTAGLARAVGREQRILYEWRKAPPLEALHSADRWVAEAGGIYLLAHRVIGHIRSTGTVSKVDRLAVIAAMDWCRWSGTVPPEAVLSALAHVLGVVHAATGEPIDQMLGILWGTRLVNLHRQKLAKSSQTTSLQ